jgi:hypothetical protein
LLHPAIDKGVRAAPGRGDGVPNHVGVTIGCRVVLRATGGMIFWLACSMDVHGVHTEN